MLKLTKRGTMHKKQRKQNKMSNILQGLNETQKHDGVFLLTESRTYKLWESAGQKISEAQLTADQINQIFKQVEQGATAAGGNRTMLGKGKDAAGAVKQAYDDLVSKAQNSGPIKGVDAMYDKAAEKLKQATGGDQGVMKYVQKYRDFAKEHPVAQGLIYSALIAAAGISGAGIGGAAALGLFKMVDKLLQGEKFSTAVGKGVTTGAMAYGASKVGDLFKGSPQGAPTTAGSDATAGAAQDTLSATRQAVEKEAMDAIKSRIANGEIAPGDQGAIRYLAYKMLAGSCMPPPSIETSVEKLITRSMGDVGTSATNTVSGTLSGVTGEQMASHPAYQAMIQKFGNTPGARQAAMAAAKSAILKGQVNESINLSESQIFLLIGKIVERQRKLDEGIMDTLKGAAGKAADWAQTKGTNLTTKVTADKLLQAWKKAGSPTDSLDVASIIQKAGVPSDSIKQVYTTMQIPFAGEKGAGASTKRNIDVDPSSVAPAAPTSTPTASAPSATANAPAADASQPATAATGSLAQAQELIAKLDPETKTKLISTLKQELSVAESRINELSNEKLGQYKKAASADATAADKAGDYKRGDKRFSGIVRATNKQFANDTKKHGQQGVAEGLEQSLSSMVRQDQTERNEYATFVKSQAGGDWSKGAKMYAQLKKRPIDDIFGDAIRLNQFMKMKFDFDKFTNEDWDNYWLLAQHCDNNRDFQKNALSIIKKYQGTDHSHYKYLYDRISMGLTGKQKYGTQNIKEQGVAEGFPHDVDHMPGPVIRNADMTTDNVKTKDKAEWDRATDSINARVFDDMSEFRTDNNGETVVGDSAVWAKWDNATQTGWFNAKGRPLKPWPVKEQGVAEGDGPRYIDNIMNQYKAGLPGQNPAALSKPTRAVDARGRTQEQWAQLVRSKFPGAKITQAKMIDGPMQATLPDGRKLGWKKVEQIDEIIDPSTKMAWALRHIAGFLTRLFPYAVGAGTLWAASGLLAPLVAASGGVAAAISALGGSMGSATGAAAGAVGGASIMQIIKNLFAADENSIQAGIKKWVERQVGDEADVQEFLLTHAKAAYDGKPGFRWRAKEWPVKLSKDQAEAYLEKKDKSWLDYEKQKIIDAEKAKAEKDKEGMMEEQLDELNCWSGYHRVAGTKAGFPGSCAKNKTNESEHKCPHCGGEMVSEELMNEKKDACYYKVKSRYKVWPSAYASGALVKCRKSGADSWGNGGKKNEGSILEGINRADESLHDWFNKEKWVRMDTKGKIKGPCAREPGEGKPKCLPQAKAHSLGKKGRASAAARKRREDPNPERSGKAINVNTKKKD